MSSLQLSRAAFKPSFTSTSFISTLLVVRLLAYLSISCLHEVGNRDWVLMLDVVLCDGRLTIFCFEVFISLLECKIGCARLLSD